MSDHTSVVIEADGGSRGNPGRAAYGAVLKDAVTGEVIAERAETLGIATNNVAEYNGLIAGLEMYQQHTPDAELEVRMDSKLIVEQMSGNWKIKHPDMKPLAMRAHRLAPFGTTFTWVPREQNKHADRLLNEVLDGKAASAAVAAKPVPPFRGWAARGTPTTLILVRHGETAHTVEKRFSSGLGGVDPGLTSEGRDQARAVADWLSPLAESLDVLVSSPVRRAAETAEIVGARLEKPVSIDDAFAEMDFGSWDGLTYEEVLAVEPDAIAAWAGALDVRPGGGETFNAVAKRVDAAVDRLLAEHAGSSVLIVSHVTPIKVVVARAIGAPLDTMYRMELAPASVTVLSFFEDGTGSMRLFNARPTL
jgi:probable phosphoglycerate mutase